MNTLETKLLQENPNLYSKFIETKTAVNLLLGKYSDNFPTYTDHSINHTLEVFEIAAEILTDEEVSFLSCDEIYVLSMSCLLHDIGMCIPEAKITEIAGTGELLSYKESHPNLSKEEFLRDIHHILSYKVIIQDWHDLKIPSEEYAYAIALVSQGHRKIELGNFDLYEPQYFAKSGKEFVCLPYLSSILRIADELDITNSRVPRILAKYYMPNNEVSVREWLKHMATSQRNYSDDKVIFKVSCSDQSIYAALQDQFEKIQSVINYCQKVIRAIPFIEKKHYSLHLSKVDVKYKFVDFDPKGIKFSFDVENVVNAFIGEDLYGENYTSIREALQNAIDSCRYKSKVLKDKYSPLIKVIVDKTTITVQDNGAGMDEFIIENFFGRLASSFYEQDKIKNQFEAIGQFGVGVFSYFLLSEYIDIETKTKDGNSLKFRFDKDPKSYFHFYDDSNRLEAGTTMTMHLKKRFHNEITFMTLERYIRNIFKHIEIPIHLTDNNLTTEIENLPFDISERTEIKNRLKLHNRKISEKLIIVESKLSEVDFEGTCGLIIGKHYKEIFSFDSRCFDNDAFNTITNLHRDSQISFSQKGVYVNSYANSNLLLLIGDVNLKKKIKINIDRNNFTDLESIFSIIQKFEVSILNKIFEYLETKYKNDAERLDVSINFLRNYLSPSYNKLISKDFIDLISKNIYVSVFFEQIYEVMSLAELVKKHRRFVYATNIEDEKQVSELLQLPVIISYSWKYIQYDILDDILVDLLKFNNMIFYKGETGYLIYHKEQPDPKFNSNQEKLKSLTGRYLSTAIQSNVNTFYVSGFGGKSIYKDKEGLDEDVYQINYNNSFIQFIIENFDKIQNNQELRKILKSGFEFLNELKNVNEENKLDELTTGDLKKINDIFKPLNEIANLKKLTKKDFK